MNQWKRLLFYILVNIVVSALTTWLVLTIWVQTHPQASFPVADVEQVGLTALPEGMLVTTESSDVPVTENDPSFNNEPTQAVEEYEVKAGDTLGMIANEYEINLEELMKFNSLKDPNAISVGMILYIPVTPEVVITDTPMPTRTLLPPGTGTPSAQDVRMVINSVISVGDIQAERVFISRTGGGVLLLSGWQLKDEDGNIFQFPDLELFEGGAVNIWTTSGTPTVVDLYWGLSRSVWQAGEMVTLIDDQGNVRATYQIP